jgi:hypothetical protein
MTANQRFSLADDRYVIDHLNSQNNGKGWCHEGDEEHDPRLRELVLSARLHELVASLIVNRNSMKTLPSGETYQPYPEERHSISWALYNAITASHLNSLNVALSIQHKFDGQLRRKKIGMRDYTSLSLFTDDVECLLCDLYGNCDQQAMDLVRQAVLAIVEQFTKYVGKDLWEEHQSANAIDYVFGIGLPDDCAIHNSDRRRMHEAVRDLTERARIVRDNPTAFSKYTVSFLNDLYENWPPLSQPAEEAESGLNTMTLDAIPF